MRRTGNLRPEDDIQCRKAKSRQEEVYLSAAPREIESQNEARADHSRLPRGLIGLLAIACGVILANIYYAQPLAGPIGEALGLSVGATGLIVTLPQIGYGLGLLFVVPLGDLVKTRALVVSALGVCMASLLVAASSKASYGVSGCFAHHWCQFDGGPGAGSVRGIAGASVSARARGGSGDERTLTGHYAGAAYCQFPG